MTITVYADPTTGYNHATLTDEVGYVQARFYGDHCVEDARMFRAALKMKQLLTNMLADGCQCYPCTQTRMILAEIKGDTP